MRAASYWMFWRAWATATDEQITRARRQYLDAFHASIMRDRHDEMLMSLLGAICNAREQRSILYVRALVHAAATVDQPQWVMSVLLMKYHQAVTATSSGPVAQERKALYAGVFHYLGVTVFEHRKRLGVLDDVADADKLLEPTLFVRAAEADPQPLHEVFADVYRRHLAIVLFDSLREASSKPESRITLELLDAVEERALAIGGHHPAVNLERGKLFIQFDQTKDKGIRILSAPDGS